MLFVTQTALELGFQYALVAMALFLSYRVLDIADLTTDGCFILGCAVSVSLTASGHPFLAIPAAMAAGACAALWSPRPCRGPWCAFSSMLRPLVFWFLWCSMPQRCWATAICR